MVIIPLKPWSALLDEAGDAGAAFEVLPASDYDVKVIKSEAKMSGNGKTMFALTLEVVNGPYRGRRMWSNLVVSPENQTALGIFFRQMNAIGIDRTFFATNPGDHQVAEALMNREFRVQVGIKSWQGQERNEVKNYYPMTATAGSPTPPPPPIVNAPAKQAPAPATPAPAPAPQAAPAAAATSAGAEAPVHEEAPAAPEQPATPAVPDTAPVVEAEVAPAEAAPAATGATPPPPPF